MSDDPQVHAHLGLVRVPNSCCENWVEYTPEAARKLAIEVIRTARDAEAQLLAIAEACADGHDWDTGYNSKWGGENETIHHCRRGGCEERRIEPGWLPFEPKQHVVPYSPKLWDCTGPGCEHCDNEYTADAMNRALSDAFRSVSRMGEAFGEALGGLPQPKLEARKFGYTWTVDATPEQLQAALDARDGNPWPRGRLVDQHPDMPADELPIDAECACGHTAPFHRTGGCFHIIEGYDWQGNLKGCPCKVDVAKLATKITGIGTEDTTP